jgi:hypothetical protein
MKKQYMIPIILGASILLAAISTSFLPSQFATGTPLANKPANPAGAPPGNMTGGPSANTTGGPSANTTGTQPGTPPAKPS